MLKDAVNDHIASDILADLRQRPKNGDIAAYKLLPLVPAAMWRSPERQRSTIVLLLELNAAS